MKPNSSPRAQISSPQVRITVPLVPRNVPWCRLGRIMLASPPACGAAADCAQEAAAKDSKVRLESTKRSGRGRQSRGQVKMVFLRNGVREVKDYRAPYITLA